MEIRSKDESRHDETFDIDDEEPVKGDSDVTRLADALQGWKLKPERLRDLLNTNQVSVKVFKMNLNEKFLANFYDLNLNARNDKRTNLKPDQKISFFVKFSLPPRGEETNCCSIKRDPKIKSRTIPSKSYGSIDDFIFDHKSVHNICFEDPNVMGAWMAQNLNFKLFSRALNQMVPTYIGEASFGLKHLILHNYHSKGHLQKLPIYASKSLLRQLPPQTSEIIGDLFVEFLFLKQNNPQKLKIPERVLITSRGGSNRQSAIEGNPIRPNTIDPIKISSTARFEKPVKEFKNPIIKDHKSENPTKEVLLQTHLYVSEGKNFSTRDQSVQNLFVSCRFLGSGDLLTSQISWNPQNPIFNFQHSIPIVLSRDFLETCCRSNFLILEVWSFCQTKNKLIGIATVPLHQIYIAYQDPNMLNLSLKMDHPVIAVDNWIQVQHVLNGEVVGSIRVLFAIGKETQILNLTRPDKKETRKNDHTAKKDQPVQLALPFTNLHEEKQKEPDQELVNKKKCDASTSTLSSDIKATQTTEENLTQDSMACNHRCDSANSCSVETSLSGNVRLRVVIHQGRNLPRIKSRDLDRRLPPNSYVTLPNIDLGCGGRIPVSSVIPESCCPTWDFSTELKVPVDFFLESRQHLILKVWHCTFAHEERPTSDKDSGFHPDYERDPIIGFVAVDLRPLLLKKGRFEKMYGWYNVMDFVGRCRGQVQLTVLPIHLNALDRQTWTRFDLSSDEETCSSHQSVSKNDHSSRVYKHDSRIKLAPTRDPKLLEPKPKVPEHVFQLWNPPEVELDLDNPSRSFLAEKMTDLADMAERMKARLEGRPYPAVKTTESAARLEKTVEHRAKNSTAKNSNTENTPFQEKPSLEAEKTLTNKSGNSNLIRESTSKIPKTHNLGHSVSNRFEGGNNFTPSGHAVSVQSKVLVSHDGDVLLDLSDDEPENDKENYPEKEPKKQDFDMMTFSISPSDSDSEIMPELENINWDVVSPESLREFQAKQASDDAENISRMAPDGGNPIDDRNK